MILLHKEIKYNIPILSSSNELSNLEENINIVMEQIKKSEVKAIQQENTPNKKMDIYQNIYMNL